MPNIALHKVEAPEQRMLLFWAIVLGLSLAGRLAALELFSGRVIGGDHAIYLALAKNMLGGHGYLVRDANLMADMRATYPPGYPVLLAGAGLILPLTYATLTLLNTAIDLACACAIGRLASHFAPKPAAHAAAAIYLVWPAKLAAAPIAQKEGLISLLVVALLLTLTKALERPDGRKAIVFGLLTCALALTQPALAPLPVALLLVTACRFPASSWLRFVLVSAAAAVIAMLPWWIRNWILFGHFVPLTAATGYGLWIGATPHGTGNWVRPPAEFLRQDEFEMSRLLAQEAWRIIVADPLRFVAHGFGKLVRAFAVEGAAADLLYHAIPHPPSAGLAKGWRFAATMFHLVILAVGLAAALARPRHLLSLFLFAGVMQILLFGIWFEFGERHRHFLTPLLLLSACAYVEDRFVPQPGNRQSGDSNNLARGT